MTAREINIRSLTDRNGRGSCQFDSRLFLLSRTLTDRWTGRVAAVVWLRLQSTVLRNHSSILSLLLSHFSPVCSRQRCDHVEVIHAEGSAFQIPIRLTVRRAAAIFSWITYSLLHEGMLPIFLENLVSLQMNFFYSRRFHHLPLSFFLISHSFPQCLVLLLSWLISCRSCIIGFADHLLMIVLLFWVLYWLLEQHWVRAAQ